MIYLRRWLIKQFGGAETFLEKASCWDWIETVSSIFLFHMPLVVLVSHRHCSREIEMFFLISWALTILRYGVQLHSYWLALYISSSIWLNPLTPLAPQGIPQTPSHICSLEHCPPSPKTKPHAPQQVLGQATTKLHSLPRPPSPAQPSSKP